MLGALNGLLIFPKGSETKAVMKQLITSQVTRNLVNLKEQKKAKKVVIVRYFLTANVKETEKSELGTLQHDFAVDFLLQKAFCFSVNYGQETKSEMCQPIAHFSRTLEGHFQTRPPGVGMTCDLDLLNSGTLVVPRKFNCELLSCSGWGYPLSASSNSFCIIYLSSSCCRCIYLIWFDLTAIQSLLLGKSKGCILAAKKN